MRAVPLAVALASLSLGTALAVEAPPTDGSLGIRLLEQNESRHVIATLAPGETLRRRLEVVNSSEQPLEVSLYAAAATDGSRGFDFAEARTPNQLTGWTSVRPGVLQLPASRNATADLEVRVPADAAEGGRYAVVWAEQAADGPAGVSLVRRVGVRMYVTVRAEALPTVPVALAAALLLVSGAATHVVRRGRRLA